MSDKKYAIKMPSGTTPYHVDVTLADCDAIEDQIKAIREQAKTRGWRDGNVVWDKAGGSYAIYIAGDVYWLNGDGNSSCPPEEFDLDPIHGNLNDLLAQGPILVGLSEDNLLKLVMQTKDPLSAYLRARLMDYRAEQEKTNGK